MTAIATFLQRFARFGLAPFALYCAVFFLITWPLGRHFTTDFFTDNGDGNQFLWAIWWFKKAWASGQSVWYTTELRYPQGTSLLGHTMAPFPVTIAALLTTFVSLPVAFNAVVVGQFALTGVTTCWLAYHISRSWTGSLLAGGAVAFSHYFYLHYFGHLNLIAFGFVPLFALVFVRLLEKPTLLRGGGAGVALALVTFCDLYYLLYAALLAMTLLADAALRHYRRDRNALFFLKRNYLRALLVFGAVYGVTAFPFVVQVLLGMIYNPLLGAHAPEAFSSDLVGPFVPKDMWRWRGWTAAIIPPATPPNPEASSAFMGFVLTGMIGYGFWRWLRARKTGETRPDDMEETRSIGPYLFGVVAFYLLSLGPLLHILGTTYRIPLPYFVLSKVFPPLALGGVTVRFMIVATLCAAVVAAVVWARLFSGSWRARAVGGALVALLVVERVPTPLAMIPVAPPPFVNILRDTPGAGAVLNVVHDQYHAQLYHQTIHGRPLIFGHLARLPRRVAEQDLLLMADIARLDYARLYSKWHIRFLVAPADRPLPEALNQAMVSALMYEIPAPQVILPQGGSSAAPLPRRVAYRDSTVIVYDLAPD